MSKRELVRLIREEDGATAVEYGLIVAVIAVALIGALALFKEEISNLFGRSGKTINKT
jgi:pilus assembly protein Flp/PilA